MARGEIGKVRVQGHDLTVEANTDGRWSLKDGDGYVGSGETLDAAKAAARKELKKRDVTVAVPFKRPIRRGYGDDARMVLVDGVADRLKAGQRHVVLATIDGERDTIGGTFGRNTGVWKHDTPDAVYEEYRSIQDEKRALDEREEKIEEEWCFDLADAVRDAIDDLVEKAVAEEPAPA